MKPELRKILDNPANKLIAVDLDGTLSEGKFWEGEEIPVQRMINFVNNLYKKGGHIIIWTARMPEYYIQTRKWLEDNGVMYHGISMHTKIGADIYIDDKAVNPDELFPKQ